MIELILEELDYYVSTALFFGLAVYFHNDLVKAAKGGNGILQWPEVLQMVCLIFFVMYSLRVIFLDVTPDGIAFSAFLAGAGIGGAFSLTNKKVADKNGTPKQ